MLYFSSLIRPQRAEILCTALMQIDVYDLSLVELITNGTEYVKEDLIPTSVPKVQISGAIHEESKDQLIDLFVTNARSGRNGDGKLWFISVGEVAQ